MEQTLLSIEHLKKSYDDNLILDDIDLEVHQGEVIVLVGPSGCGTVSYTHLTLPTKLEV